MSAMPAHAAARASLCEAVLLCRRMSCRSGEGGGLTRYQSIHDGPHAARQPSVSLSVGVQDVRKQAPVDSVVLRDDKDLPTVQVMHHLILQPHHLMHTSLPFKLHLPDSCRNQRDKQTGLIVFFFRECLAFRHDVLCTLAEAVPWNLTVTHVHLFLHDTNVAPMKLC
jgi:hypothetical protein